MNKTPEERAAEFYADQIKRTGSKVLHLFPHRKTMAAAPNKTRYEVLRRLLGYSHRPAGLSHADDLAWLERMAEEKGFQIVDVDPADYDPKAYRPLL